MARQVKIIVEIDDKGMINIESDGTEGTQCDNLLKVFETMDSFKKVEETHKANYKTKSVQTATYQTAKI